MGAERVFVTPPMLVAIPEAFEPLITCGLEVVFNSGPYPLDDDALSARLHDAVAVVAGLDCVSGKVFATCPQLRIVARNGVGMDNVDLSAATQHGVVVTAPLGANSTSVAELTVGLIIDLMRQVIPRHDDLQKGIWRREQGFELSGKTLGIVGLGRIGKRVATRALAFEMRIIANDIVPDYAFAEEHGISFVSFNELLARADVVTLHVPLTPLTADMINEETLTAMKRGAYLINTARAAVVDAVALAAALGRHHLAGVASDVHYVEGDKYGKAHEALVGRSNVITTPHLGGYTVEALRRTTEAAVQSISDVLKGKRPDGLMNPEVWS